MYHFGQRYYDPASMRWTQPDRLDQAGDLREGNQYVYAGGDPINSSDPSGLSSGCGSNPYGCNNRARHGCRPGVMRVKGICAGSLSKTPPGRNRSEIMTGAGIGITCAAAGLTASAAALPSAGVSYGLAAATCAGAITSAAGSDGD